MTVTYIPAPEAEKIGRQLIAKHHTDLIGERVDFVFRSEAQKTAGRVIWGKARKVTGLNAYLATVTGLGSAVNEFKKAAADVGGATVSAGGRTVEVGPPEDEAIDPFFVIELAHDVWDTLDGKQRIALVDHELSHCTIRMNANGDAVATVAPHDLEEFEAVIKRHGFYRSDVKHFAKVVVDVAGDQMSLLDDGDGE